MREEQAIMSQQLRKPAVKVQLIGMVLDYSDASNSSMRGSVHFFYADEDGNELEKGVVAVTDAMLAKWNGTARQILNYVVEQLTDVKP